MSSAIGSPPGLRRIILLPTSLGGRRADGAIQCPRCGSKGFHVHQRSSKNVKDLFVESIPLVRYLCKACRYAWRDYPAGMGPGRQTATLRRVSILLYCLGLSYPNVRWVLAGLGCPLSIGSIRNNVMAAGVIPTPDADRERLKLAPAGPARLSGPDGSLSFRLLGSDGVEPGLEVEIATQSGGTDLDRRLTRCAHWLDLAL